MTTLRTNDAFAYEVPLAFLTLHHVISGLRADLASPLISIGFGITFKNFLEASAIVAESILAGQENDTTGCVLHSLKAQDRVSTRRAFEEQKKGGRLSSHALFLRLVILGAITRRRHQ
jgi:hypothetical protein